jgi:hypothetical protein
MSQPRRLMALVKVGAIWQNSFTFCPWWGTAFAVSALLQRHTSVWYYPTTGMYVHACKLSFPRLLLQTCYGTRAAQHTLPTPSAIMMSPLCTAASTVSQKATFPALHFRGEEKFPPGGGESVKSNSTHASAMHITPVLAAVARNSNGCLQDSRCQADTAGGRAVFFSQTLHMTSRPSAVMLRPTQQLLMLSSSPSLPGA